MEMVIRQMVFQLIQNSLLILAPWVQEFRGCRNFVDAGKDSKCFLRIIILTDRREECE